MHGPGHYSVLHLGWEKLNKNLLQVILFSILLESLLLLLMLCYILNLLYEVTGYT